MASPQAEGVTPAYFAQISSRVGKAGVSAGGVAGGKVVSADGTGAGSGVEVWAADGPGEYGAGVSASSAVPFLLKNTIKANASRQSSNAAA